MKTVATLALIGVAALGAGCSITPYTLAWNQSPRPYNDNVWLHQADARNGYGNAMRNMSYRDADARPGMSTSVRAATPAEDLGPRMPLRADVRAARDANRDTAATRASTTPVAAPAVASAAAMQACAQQRASFGGAEEKRIAFLIQLDIEQARAVAESTSIDAATKAQLLSELSREVKALSRKSQNLELFRDGVYALCQAHASGAITPAAYSERFDALVRTVSTSMKLESAAEQAAEHAAPVADSDRMTPVSMPRR